MSKDYASRSNKTKTKAASRGNAGKRRAPTANSQPPSKHWIVGVIVLAMFIGGMIFFKKHHEEQEKAKLMAERQIKAEKSAAAARMPAKPKFDFYTILPKEKVWEPKTAVQQERELAKQQPPKPVAYILQVAAFQQYADADQLKAKLLLQGYMAQADTKPTNGWYRVWIGPLKTISDAQHIQVKVGQVDKLNGLILKIAVN